MESSRKHCRLIAILLAFWMPDVWVLKFHGRDYLYAFTQFACFLVSLGTSLLDLIETLTRALTDNLLYVQNWRRMLSHKLNLNYLNSLSWYKKKIAKSKTTSVAFAKIKFSTQLIKHRWKQWNIVIVTLYSAHWTKVSYETVICP